MTKVIEFSKFHKPKPTPTPEPSHKKATEITLLEGTAEDLFGYAEIMNVALREVVKQILVKVVGEGLPGNHHLYIRFDTTHEGVSIDDELKIIYPESMTIVLQHKFSELSVHDNHFGVTLSFDGVLKRILVPFHSIISLVDPSVPFGVGIHDRSGKNDY